MTNCKNCGAPLVNGKCEYCRTEYGSQDGITLHINSSVILGSVANSIFTANEVRKIVGLKEK